MVIHQVKHKTSREKDTHQGGVSVKLKFRCKDIMCQVYDCHFCKANFLVLLATHQDIKLRGGTLPPHCACNASGLGCHNSVVIHAVVMTLSIIQDFMNFE